MNSSGPDGAHPSIANRQAPPTRAAPKPTAETRPVVRLRVAGGAAHLSVCVLRSALFGWCSGPAESPGRRDFWPREGVTIRIPAGGSIRANLDVWLAALQFGREHTCVRAR